MKYDQSLIGKHNMIGGAPRDIREFCDRHEPLSFDALLLRDCRDPALLRRAIALLKTGGVLAIRGVDPSCTPSTPSAHAEMLNEVFENRWNFYFCRDGNVIWTRICRREGQSEVLWSDLPLSHYMDLLKRGVPFSYLRYGDGEWNGVLGTLRPGSKKQKFIPELREALRVSLVEYHRDPNYIMALAPIYHYRDRIGQWELIAAFLQENKLDDIKWVSTQPFNRASETGELWPFIQHLQQGNIVIVGPRRLRGLKKLFPKAAFVIIPNRDCYAGLAAIQGRILAQKLPAIILFTAGPAEVVLIHELYGKIGDSSTMIDIGTMWGPYIGKVERGGHRRMPPEMIAKNVGKQ